MANKCQRECKIETTIKNLMLEAFKRLHVASVKKHERFSWQPEGSDDALIVELWGGSHLSDGQVKLESHRYGQWFANLNGLAQNRVGKPWRRLTPEQLIECSISDVARP